MRTTDPNEVQILSRWLRERERRGLSWAELSAASGVAMWTLRYWHRKLGLPSRSAGRRRRTTFVPVAVRESSSPAPEFTFELTTPSGYQLRLPAAIASADLRRLLEALPPRC